MAKTAKPKLSGLTVARKNNKFTLYWSLIKNCKDQDIKILINNKQVRKADLTNTRKKYEYSVDLSKYYPNTDKKLTEVSFRLAQRQKKKKESAFSSQKEFKIYKQRQPEYVQPVQDNTNHDTFAYSWDRNKEDDDPKTGHRMFTYYEYDTCLVNEKEKADWSLSSSQTIQTIDPTTGTFITNSPSHNTITDPEITTVIIRESQADITARKKRYFRIRCIGPAGPSDYRESEHQLGGSDSVSIQSTTTNFTGSTDTGTSGSFPINIKNGNPGDSIIVEYAITAPYVTTTDDGTTVKSRMVLPPGFTGWTSGDVFSGAGIPDTYSFNYPDAVVEDTQLFIRVNQVHDNITSYGTPFIMNTKQKAITSGSQQDTTPEIVIGALSAPTLSAVQVNEGAKEVTINCTNNTRLADGGNRSFIAVYERLAGSEKAIGIIPFSSSASSVTFPYDDGAEAFGIRCFVADYSPKTRTASGVTTYTISNYLMQSSGIIWEEDAISKPPQNVNVQRYNSSTVLITWDWNWAQADSAEISWSDNEIIWDSIEEPSSYILTNTRQGKRYITGLSPTTYHFRVRFIKTENETTTFGVYSETKHLTLSSAPDIPTLTLSDEDNVVAVTDQVTAYWDYRSTDGTSQIYAELAEATKVNDTWSYAKLRDAQTNTETQYTFTPEQFGWTNGESHYICVRVRSASGQDSEGYSTPVLLKIAPLPIPVVAGIGGNTDAIRPPVSGEDSYDLSDYALKRLPIEFTVSGAGRNGFCSVIIERSENYSIERPDETRTTGFQGETIIANNYYPAANSTSDTISVSITLDDLKLGSLDNTAPYTMYVSITDEYKQTVQVPPYNFRVDWDYYAKMPSADIVISHAEDVAFIQPTAEGNIAEGDVCQIYRMSADKPQLILDNGVFGETYVDPFPTFGMFGGYRIVYVSKYGDYKTEDNIIAMTEYSIVGNDEDIEAYDKFMVSLDFDGMSTDFKGNISLSHSWEKDFQLTRYLGGSVEGDWNPGIKRNGTINGMVPVEYETETAYNLRLLADYAGRCHVRTPEGSNFVADVQVKDDREEKKVTRIGKFSLSYTKVDAGEDDVVTLEEWRKNNPAP